MFVHEVLAIFSSFRSDSQRTTNLFLNQGWPIREPDIIVTTPAALLNHVDVDRRRRMEFMHGVKYVVSFLFYDLM